MGRFRALILLLVLLFAGCSSPRRNVNIGGGGGSTNGQLYVATPTAILRYASALSANGTVAPTATISGSATQISAPQHILIDAATNRLFVPNQGNAAILIFQNASTISGNVAPSAVMGSASFSAPVDVALDGTKNLLYVADGSNILVFSGESAFSGTFSAVPVSTISTGFAIGAIFLDVANDRMFLTDTTTNSVDIMDSASAQTSVALFTGTISGTQTALNQPMGVALDGSGRLIVSNAAGASVIIYPAAAVPAGGNVAPAAIINGSATRLASPQQIVVNNSAANGGEAFVADPGAAAVLVYGNLATVGGNAGPTRAISGAGTDLSTNAVNGLTLDVTR
jgi:hypothetical protein